MNWLIASSLFMAYQYLLRFETAFTREDDTLSSQKQKNIWKMKDQCDFLRYNEYELGIWNMCVYPIVEYISRMTWNYKETLTSDDYILLSIVIVMNTICLVKFIHASSSAEGANTKRNNIVFLVFLGVVYISFLVASYFIWEGGMTMRLKMILVNAIISMPILILYMIHTLLSIKKL